MTPEQKEQQEVNLADWLYAQAILNCFTDKEGEAFGQMKACLDIRTRHLGIHPDTARTFYLLGDKGIFDTLPHGEALKVRTTMLAEAHHIFVDTLGADDIETLQAWERWQRSKKCEAEFDAFGCPERASEAEQANKLYELKMSELDARAVQLGYKDRGQLLLKTEQEKRKSLYEWLKEVHSGEDIRVIQAKEMLAEVMPASN